MNHQAVEPHGVPNSTEVLTHIVGMPPLAASIRNSLESANTSGLLWNPESNPLGSWLERTLKHVTLGFDAYPGGKAVLRLIDPVDSPTR